jgi:hypothetical protein
VQVITWIERDGKHVSYASGQQATNLLDMIGEDATMTLVSVVITGHLQRMTFVKRGVWRITLQGHRSVLAASAALEGVRWSYQVRYAITLDAERRVTSVVEP